MSREQVRLVAFVLSVLGYALMLVGFVGVFCGLVVMVFA